MLNKKNNSEKKFYITLLAAIIALSGFLMIENSLTYQNEGNSLSIQKPATRSSATRLLVKYTRFKPSTEEYRIINSQGVVLEKLDFSPEKYSIVADPTGSNIIRRSPNKIEIASGSKNRTFKTIVENDKGISDIIFSSDGTKIAYTTSSVLKKNQDDIPLAGKSTLFIVDADGRNNKKIMDIELYSKLVGFNAADGTMLYSVCGFDLCDNFSKLTAVSTENFTRKRIGSFDAFNGYALMSDLSKMYYSDGKTKDIMQYDFQSGTSSKIFSLHENGIDQGDNTPSIGRFFVSPDQTTLIFTAYNTGSSGAEITYEMNLNTNQVREILHDKKYYNIGPEGWSPDGKLILFNTFCYGCGKKFGYDNEGEYYFMNYETGQLYKFFTSEMISYLDQTIHNESMHLETWLRGN